MPKYLVHVLYEKSASHELDLFDTAEDAADHIDMCNGCGAVRVEVFECTEVEFLVGVRRTVTAVRRKEAE